MLSGADDYIEEREGGRLVIFQRSGIFQARIYRGKGSRGYIYRSLNTRDLEQARKAATKLWHQLEFKAEHGLPVTTYTMSRVIDEYVAMREKDLGSAKPRLIRAGDDLVEDPRVPMTHQESQHVG